MRAVRIHGNDACHIALFEDSSDSVFIRSAEPLFLFTEMERLAALPSTPTKDLSYLHPHYSLLLKEPDAVFARGLPVNTWTVNERPVLTSLRAMEPRGMRSIMTDDLSLAETEHRTHG